MTWNKTLICISLAFVFASITCRESISFVPENELSIAFYNLDNLFDDVDDTTHDDHEFTSAGKYHWTPERYRQKLQNMEKVLRQVIDGQAPDVLGVCELENRKAFADLLATGVLKDQYGIVHYDSPDERGIDVALAYNKSKIKVLESYNFKVKINDRPSDRTRDILWVKTLSTASHDTIQFIVCHFPSRREGKEKSEQDRLDAAAVCKSVIDAKCKPEKQNLVIMGDFNDEPWDSSIAGILGASDIDSHPGKGLLNLMWHFRQQKRGTYNYRHQWNILDQLIISKALSDGRGVDYSTGSVEIMHKPWMMQTGKYEGFPLRTFGGDKWLNGYSDHLPVYFKIKLKK